MDGEVAALGFEFEFFEVFSVKAGEVVVGGGGEC
jgi:hypothetical protein